MNSVSVPLPPPLSAAFRNVPGKGRVKTTRYITWLAAAGWAVKLQPVERVKGPAVVDITFYRPDKRRRDLDNLLKASLDLMTKHELIEDDSKVVDLRVRWAESSEHQGTAVIKWGAA